MASGDTLLTFKPYDNEPPSSNFATLDTRNGHPTLDHDGSTAESCIFSAVLPRNYAGGGITVYIHYSMTSATSGNVVMSSAFERIGDGSQDIDANGFATANNSASTAVPATSGNVDIMSIAHTNGAQLDSIAVGEGFRLQVARVPADAGDDVTTDLEAIAVELKET